MFCIDYLLGSSSRSRQIVFLINIEETVSESNRGRRDVQTVRTREGNSSWSWRTAHTLYDRRSFRLRQHSRGEPSRTENQSDPTEWMAAGPETSVQSCRGLSLGENPLAAADCALEHNPNKGVFTLNVYRHPSYRLRFISGTRWIHCAQRPGQGRVFSEAIFKWSNSS